MWNQGNFSQMSPMVCGCNQVRPAYDMRRRCSCRRRSNCGGSMFVLIVVLFILLIIVGANFRY